MMATGLKSLAASVCFASACALAESQASEASGPLSCGNERERAGASLVVNCAPSRRRRPLGSTFEALVPRKAVALRERWRTSVGSLASDSHLWVAEDPETERRGLYPNPKDAPGGILSRLKLESDSRGDFASEVDFGDGDGDSEQAARAASRISEDGTEVLVRNGNDLGDGGSSRKEEAQRACNPLKFIVDSWLIRMCPERSGMNREDTLSSILHPLRFEGDCRSENSASEGDFGDGGCERTEREELWMSDEETKVVVSEVTLTGDELRVREYPANEATQRDANPLNSTVDSVLNEISEDGRDFSLLDVGGVWKAGEDAGEMKVPDLSTSGLDAKEGVSPLGQWTTIELTMQHSQLARIATDVHYVRNAFAFFGAVRVVEALLIVYSTSPPDFGKLKELLNALDPFTISWLAHNLRQPITGLANVDPLDLEKVLNLKSSVWEELHKFFERQWKIMATIALARTLAVVVTHAPAAEIVTSKVKFLWDALMALPVF